MPGRKKAQQKARRNMLDLRELLKQRLKMAGDHKLGAHAPASASTSALN